MSKENYNALRRRSQLAIDSSIVEQIKSRRFTAAPVAAAPQPAPALAAESPLMGKPVMIDGQAAPDGVYTRITGGMVSSS
jgi:hypothetical protein